ncbi:MAG: amino acid adenylation domain-containing protein [Scytonematopsis contorta HA4267-MV1]|jgi:amino acid adenylation domain-containing protein|nr:amino acid adenylation domain-containing protein [Scytonematopsis contorta HA4267-MV1]
MKNFEDIYPLSSMQQGMLFHSLYAPESEVYFTQFSCILRGNLNLQAFEQAWQQVVAKHSVLRTAFVWEHLSEPLQVVHRQVKTTVETLDWRLLSVEEQQQQLDIFLQSQRQQGFQLSQAPLMRLHLIQFAEECYQFVWGHHHLLLDGWSLPLVLKDLSYFYQAFYRGENLHHQPTVSYRNYIAWLQKQDLAKAKEFWRQKLKGFIAPTPLTVDRTLSLLNRKLSNQELSNQKQLVSYGEQQIQLTVQSTATAKSFARQHQLTMNNLVQATWALLLSRYSGQTEVVFGATVSGRPPSLAGIESMVGLFINTLPMLVKVSAEAELLPWLKNLQVEQVECEQYSYSPLVEIQGVSDVPKGTSLFESIVVFENYPLDAAMQQTDGSLSISDIQTIEQTNYPLTVVAVLDEQLCVKISYDSSKFDDATITRMLGHFRTLFEGIIANSVGSISQLPLLTEVERQQLLVEWNSITEEYPQDKCIHQLIEAQVEKTPNAIAVVFGNQQLTYRELDNRANQLANHLQTLGVCPEMFVGLCMEPSLEMVVGLLGILKADGVYVPLDPRLPKQRLAFMLEDTQISVLLTQKSLSVELPIYQAKVICLDNDWEMIAQNSVTMPVSLVKPQNLACVFYTSGSTGNPKGVLVVHQGLVNYALAAVKDFELQSSDRILQLASLSFDVVLEELLPTWLSGATVVLRDRNTVVSGAELQKLIEQQQLTGMELTTAYWQQWVSELSLTQQTPPSSLRFVIMGGEMVLPEKLATWQQFDIPLFHVYGLTETSITSTTYKLSHSLEEGQEVCSELPIGRPMANTQIYILDRYLQPVPIGVPGELYIGGVSLARGYLNRPNLTAERFISNPFNQSFGERLYKTGDLACYLPTGDIKFLGRIDNQVKLRGFRIELGEIESLLAQHPDVEQTIVIMREDILGDKYLAAYLVANQNSTPSNSQLHNFLSEKLPEYMIPSVFVSLKTIPLTTNGKVNYQALPIPDITSQADRQKAFVAPRNSLEKQLADIWSQVLNIKQVGIHDNFFLLGGHSLLATRLISMIRDTFKVDLPLSSIFEKPTIADFVTLIVEKQVEQVDSQVIAQILTEIKKNQHQLNKT